MIMSALRRRDHGSVDGPLMISFTVFYYFSVFPFLVTPKGGLLNNLNLEVLNLIKCVSFLVYKFESRLSLKS